jgi:hypothetical protein
MSIGSADDAKASGQVYSIGIVPFVGRQNAPCSCEKYLVNSWLVEEV